MGDKSVFVTELPLRDPSARIERIMLSRLDIERFAYNQFVTELIRRDTLLRESKRYQHLSAESRATKKGPRSSNPVMVSFAEKQDRTEAWKALKKSFDLGGSFCLSEYVPKVAKIIKARSGCNNVPVGMLHEIASRAWVAYDAYFYGKRSGSGRRGKPKRRSWKEPLTTISSRAGAGNGDSLRFTGKGIWWSNGLLGEKRNIIEVPALIDLKDDVIRHALAEDENGKPLHPVRQVRVGYRLRHGKRRWFVQLVLAGEAYKKPRLESLRPAGPVGVDVGSKHISIAAPEANHYETVRLNPNVEKALRQGQREERLRSRAQDRSRRATNPHAFDEKGRFRKGARIKIESSRYLALGEGRKETQRILSETKRQQTNALANRIVSMGESVHMEKLNHAAWQRAGMGRSMLASTPGALTVAIRKACEKYGKDFVHINTQKAKLSQLCHACGGYHKDPIKGSIESRMSTCLCGREPMQRDQYSAFLASLCDAEGTVDANHAERAWARISRSLAEGGNTASSEISMASATN